MSNSSGNGRPEGGRPQSTSRAELERVALHLFGLNGFDETSVEDVAAAAGIARRTFFRYFPSKTDLVWGDYRELIATMRARLRAVPDTIPMMDALRAATIEFNSVPREVEETHRVRMSLILTVPTLLANSTLRYGEWRAVVAEFAARRLQREPGDLLPVTIGHGALGATLAAYEQWLVHPDADLPTLLSEAFAALTEGFHD